MCAFIHTKCLYLIQNKRSWLTPLKADFLWLIIILGSMICILKWSSFYKKTVSFFGEEKMKLSFSKLTQTIVGEKFLNIVLAIVFSLSVTLLIKAKVFPFLLIKPVFDGGNLVLQISLLVVYFVIFVLLYFFFIWIFRKFIGFIKPLVAKLQPDNQNEQSQKTIITALIIVSVGVLSIFIINSLFTRFDTKNWQLKGLNIIPAEEPIGNDFRVGLYWPAQNLVESGFKAIGPDGTYPSVYPPLVSLLSLPYLLFDAQTAYMMNNLLIFVLNFLVLLIAVLIVNKLFLSRLIKDQLTCRILSILLFIVMAFYTYSGYPFLFSIERGNVDVIAMFFIMLSMWTLIEHPKRVWLQVIFLSIATHYKIYPLILFLVLFYYHGRKLFIPMLVINLVFLFSLGPNIAFSFIQSLVSGGSGAGVGNRWSWVGNHAAYSFAVMLTQRYAKLANSFNELFIVAMLVPFIIWVQGMVRIIRNKYSPINAVLLMMISIPLMGVLPTISNDYRLVIFSAAFLLLIGLNLYQISEDPSWERILELLAIMVIMFLIAKPYVMQVDNRYSLDVTQSFFINNKYVWCVALEAIMVWNIFRHKNKPQLNQI